MNYDGMRHVRDVKLFDTKLTGEQGEWPALDPLGTHVVLQGEGTIASVNYPTEDIYDSSNLFTLNNDDNLDFCVLNIGIRVDNVTVGAGVPIEFSTFYIFAWPEPHMRRGLKTHPLFAQHAMSENPPKIATAFQRSWCSKPMSQLLSSPSAVPPFFGTLQTDFNTNIYSFRDFPINMTPGPTIAAGDRVLWTTMIGNATYAGVPSISGLRRIKLLFWFPAKRNEEPITDLFVDMEIWASFFEGVEPR